jgi:hypothetical protein
VTVLRNDPFWASKIAIVKISGSGIYGRNAQMGEISPRQPKPNLNAKYGGINEK